MLQSKSQAQPQSHVNSVLCYVVNPNVTAKCQYCPVSETNDFLGTFDMAKDIVSRSVGLVAVYDLFSFLIPFGMYGLARAPRKAEKDSM